MKKPNFPIDFVITWVDQTDPEWRKKYQQYAGKNYDKAQDIRYRDYGTLKYVFRSIDKYAPWVNKVFLVTDHQFPEWLNFEFPKLIQINHEDYIEKKYLPTFDSNVLDLNFYRINSLAEHFVYFNDDMFLNKPTKPSDFFDLAGNPRDTLGLNAIMPNTLFDHTHVNNLMIINQTFSKWSLMRKKFTKFFNFKNFEWNLFTFLLLPWPYFTRFYDPHIQLSFKKSSLEQVVLKYPEIIEQTGKAKFRTADDFSIWVVRYIQMLKGEFTPRSAHIGKNYKLKDYKKISYDIKQCQHMLLNINDNNFKNITEYNQAVLEVTRAFKKKFPRKSCFEK